MREDVVDLAFFWAQPSVPRVSAVAAFVEGSSKQGGKKGGKKEGKEGGAAARLS